MVNDTYSWVSGTYSWVNCIVVNRYGKETRYNLHIHTWVPFSIQSCRSRYTLHSISVNAHFTTFL
jgi:hypothetical protein